MVLVSGLFASAALAERIDCKDCRCENHVQGMAADENAVNLSFTTKIFKTGFQGILISR